MFQTHRRARAMRCHPLPRRRPHLPPESQRLWSERLEQRNLLTLPTGFSIEPFVAGLVEPVAFAYAPDGRIFVAEKAGRVQVVQNGHVVDTFIDLRNEVNSKHDRGLIGIALDPNFAVNRRVYLNFTVELQPGNPDSTAPAGGSLIRVAGSAANSNLADPATRATLMTGHDNQSNTHSVGDVEFDSAGNLIVSWGDGGFLDSLRFASQNIDSLQGKIFRINPETGAGVPGNPYFEPANPSSVRSRVLAVGVRNPWRISRDAATGSIYFGDVTDGGPEEINVIETADVGTPLNFGWPYYEGTRRTNYGTPPQGFQSTFPYVSYNHIGNYDAITCGVVFRGNKYPASYDSKFFFANFGQDVVYTADAAGNYTEFGRNEWAFPVDINLANGRIQMASIVNGTLYELVHSSAPSGRPRAAASVSGVSGLTVNFSSTGTTDPNDDPLAFYWDFDQDGRTDSTLANPSFTYLTPGTYEVLLTVVDPSGNSSPREVQVQVAVENLAVGKPASQSSTLFGEIASIAVDGSLTSGHTHTGFDAQAWWQVDLQTVQTIGQISIYNRDDLNTEFLANYYVMVADTPFPSTSLADALANADWVYFDPGQAGLAKAFNVEQRGRYVRIQLAGTNAISLREVRVYRGQDQGLNDPPAVAVGVNTTFGEAPISFKFNSNLTSDPNGDPLTYAWDFGDGQKSTMLHPSNTYVSPGQYTVRLTVTDSRGGTANRTLQVNVLPRVPLLNLALGKPATQSSTAYGGLASRAVDGNESGDHVRKKSVSHTALQRQPFWEVDLGQVYDLDLVRLFNRTDLGPNKLKDVWVLVSAVPFQSGNLDAVRSAPGTWSTFVAGLAGRQRDVAIGQQGRYLRIQLAGDNAALAMAEVVVLGKPTTSFRHNGHEYQLTSQPVTWSQARDQARALGGTLAVIDDAAENAFLAAAFGPALFHTDMTDQYLEDQFGWESDQIITFTNWDASGVVGQSETNDFGVFNGATGLWRLGTAADVRYGIVEIGPPLPEQFFYYNGKVYGLTQTQLTWAAARSEALAKSGDLVKIDDAAENAWLRQAFGSRNYFTGLNDQSVESQFRWTDGTAASYANFAAGEPNDVAGNQDAVIFAGSSGQWYDWSASYLAYAIIEYPI